MDLPQLGFGRAAPRVVLAVGLASPIRQLAGLYVHLGAGTRISRRCFRELGLSGSGGRCGRLRRNLNTNASAPSAHRCMPIGLASDRSLRALAVKVRWPSGAILQLVQWLS